MKVLLINNFHYIKGGSEAVYFNMADMLERNGHEVIFFSCSSTRNINRGQTKYFVKPNNEVNPVIGAFRYIYNGAAKRNLERLIVEHKPDIAHIHLFWGGLSSSILGVLKKHNIPVVHTAHDYRMICPAYTFRRSDGSICEQCLSGNYTPCLTNRCSKGKLLHSALMTWEMYFRRLTKAVEKIDAFVFVSRFSYNQHLKALPSLNEKKCIVAHNAVDIPTADYSPSEYYLYFGRLSPEKGIKTLIKAFTTLKDKQLKIVGEGPIEQELKDIITTDNIEMCGYQSGQTLRQTIAQSKAIIVPSEWYENNPMTIIEASSMGVPAIGATIGGIPEIIKEGETGYLFKPQNVSELIDAVKKIESLTTEQYRQMRVNCRAFAAATFDPQVLYKKIIELYNTLL